MEDGMDNIEKGMQALRSKDYEAAVKAFEEATFSDPDDSQAFSYLGAAYTAAGRYNAAIGAFKKATDLKPLDAKLHYNLGQAYEVADVPQEAYHEYCRALRLDPSYTLAWQACTALKLRMGQMAAHDMQLAA
jgi:Flp pilus assembly protein TadD